ncbi:MAG: discoidin domain-containing protein [Candidatus Zipacnadales bacterium]
MIALSQLGIVILMASRWPCHPQGAWEWVTEFPFRSLTVVASSEQADRWPASNAIDGEVAEPESLWQTLRDSPQSAWLELRLRQPRRIAGVNIYHQNNPRYYRSVDYSIACWVEGQWRTVAEVTGNTTAGWREHPFSPLETARVRINITRSEYGYRMGLNEVRLVFASESSPVSFTRLSLPYRCGRVADMGVISFEAILPEGTRIELQTRTARDEGGSPGEWAAWSAPYVESGAHITSPRGEWVQYRATYHCSPAGEPILRRVRLGSPHCVAGVQVPSLIPRPGEFFKGNLCFTEPMDTTSRLQAQVQFPGAPPLLLKGGYWNVEGRAWHFTPQRLGPLEGLASLRVSGGKRRDGLLMMDETLPLLIGTGPVLKRLAGIADWMMANEQQAIFVEGYCERTLLGLYEITGEQRYLDHVRRWAHKLLDLQQPAGYWGTGYGDVYFADTGSALGLLINFYKFATPEEQNRIDTALAKYFHLLWVTGDSSGKPFVHPDGSLGVGYQTDRAGQIVRAWNKPYTIATALTGAEIFAAWYYIKGDEQYKRLAIKACDWLLDTMAGDPPPDPLAAPGQIPYCIDDWNPDRRDRHELWEQWPYDTSAYAGEGFIAAWTYIADPLFREGLGRRVRPHIEWLLRTQNPDGSWAKQGSEDQRRSHGVVNLLLWYHENVEPDPRVAEALRRYCQLLVDEERSRYLNIPGDGIATSLAGRALVELVQPGVDCYRWRETR